MNKAILLVLAALSPALAATRSHDITIDDYFTLAWVREVALSDDGAGVAYTEERWQGPRDKRNRDVWVVDPASGERRRLTFDPASDANPDWSADGRFIYFTRTGETADKDGDSDEQTQVWRVRPDGGEPQQVTRVEGGIGAYRLSADGRALYYTVGVEKVDPEWKELRERFDMVDYGHGVTEFSELWRLDLESWRAEKLVDERRVIRGFTVTADGGRIAMRTTPDEELIYNEGWSRLDVYDAATKTVTTVTPDGWRAGHPSPFGWLDDGVWADDGGALAFTVSFDGYPTLVYVVEWRDGRSALRELERPGEIWVDGGSLRWRPHGRDLLFVAQDHARSRLCAFTGVRDGRQGPLATLTPGDVTVEAYDLPVSGRDAVVLTSTLTDPPDLWRVASDGTLRRLTRVNPQVDGWKLPRISIVRWKGDGGREVEGILELPPDHGEGDGPLPMIVHIHGGPTWATQYRFRFRQYGRTALAARGYALLSPNYRGSTGYGDTFLTELIGRENDVDVKDILAGVDAMVERGIADPERLGVMGWSNGGFLTDALVAATRRFKAASSGAGVVDQVLQWGIEDTPGHVINFNDGQLPWEAAELYRAGSPLYGLGDAATPTLIHVGGGDERVPAAQSRTFYRALHVYRGVPSELLVYPGEPHGLEIREHQRAKMEWDHAWFDRYVRGN